MLNRPRPKPSATLDCEWHRQRSSINSPEIMMHIVADWDILAVALCVYNLVGWPGALFLEGLIIGLRFDRWIWKAECSIFSQKESRIKQKQKKTLGIEKHSVFRFLLLFLSPKNLFKKKTKKKNKNAENANWNSTPYSLDVPFVSKRACRRVARWNPSVASRETSCQGKSLLGNGKHYSTTLCRSKERVGFHFGFSGLEFVLCNLLIYCFAFVLCCTFIFFVFFCSFSVFLFLFLLLVFSLPSSFSLAQTRHLSISTAHPRLYASLFLLP